MAKRGGTFKKHCAKMAVEVCVGIVTRLGVGSARGAFRDSGEPSRREAPGGLGLYGSSAESLAHSTKRTHRMNK